MRTRCGGCCGSIIVAFAVVVLIKEVLATTKPVVMARDILAMKKKSRKKNDLYGFNTIYKCCI